MSKTVLLEYATLTIHTMNYPRLGVRLYLMALNFTSTSFFCLNLAPTDKKEQSKQRKQKGKKNICHIT